MIVPKTVWPMATWVVFLGAEQGKALFLGSGENETKKNQSYTNFKQYVLSVSDLKVISACVSPDFRHVSSSKRVGTVSCTFHLGTNYFVEPAFL